MVFQAEIPIRILEEDGSQYFCDNSAHIPREAKNTVDQFILVNVQNETKKIYQ